ncbi:MAG TPA: hypothetical protein VIW24_29735 [Aldersonia sp.]
MNTVAVPILLIGYGPVAQHYAAVLRRRREELRSRYRVDLRIVAIRGRASQVVLPDGAAPPERARWSARGHLAELLSDTSPVVVAQAVPSQPRGVDEALSDGLAALAYGAHLVSATKSPLLSGWSALHAAARAHGRSIRISAATGAALPAGDIARAGLRGFEVRAIRGCLNGTATYVLDRLRDGVTLVDAIAVAQDRGIAEADPAADLSGIDAATKLRLLAGLVWEWDAGACTVETDPIDAATAPRALGAAARGAVLRHVGSARVEDPGRVVVALREFPRTAPPFGALVGPEKAVTFECGAAGDITVSGGRSSPLGAALAMVKDTLSVAIDPAPGLG